jgi:hypothetical protein
MQRFGFDRDAMACLAQEKYTVISGRSVALRRAKIAPDLVICSTAMRQLADSDSVNLGSNPGPHYGSVNAPMARTNRRPLSKRGRQTGKMMATYSRTEEQSEKLCLPHDGCRDCFLRWRANCCSPSKPRSPTLLKFRIFVRLLIRSLVNRQHRKPVSVWPD